MTLEDGLRSLFQAPVTLCVANPAMYAQPGWAEEEACLANAISVRRAEFRAGRACARTALSALGFPPVAIPRTADRTPVWPDSVVGSITHCAGVCAAVTARKRDLRSVGLDSETAGALNDREALQIANREEMWPLSGLLSVEAVGAGALAFSAKEAFYKAYFPVAHEVLAFDDVRLDFVANDDSGSRGHFCARHFNRARAMFDFAMTIRGAWWINGSHVHCGAEAFN